MARAANPTKNSNENAIVKSAHKNCKMLDKSVDGAYFQPWETYQSVKKLPIR